MARGEAGRLKGETAPRWSATEDFILEQLVGKVSYQMIALRLGRRPSAVQRRASAKGLSARANWTEDKETRAQQREARLCAPEDDLSEFLVECDEPPVLPHAGDRGYHREYKRRQRASA